MPVLIHFSLACLLQCLGSILYCVQKKCEKDTNQFDRVRNVEMSHSMIFYWLINPVSTHETPSPILREADRGRAVTHEYSSDLRQEIIYHLCWAHLACHWRQLSKERHSSYVITEQNMCSIVALDVILANKQYKYKHIMPTKPMSNHINKPNFIEYFTW